MAPYISVVHPCCCWFEEKEFTTKSDRTRSRSNFSIWLSSNSSPIVASSGITEYKNQAFSISPSLDTFLFMPISEAELKIVWRSVANPIEVWMLKRRGTSIMDIDEMFRDSFELRCLHRSGFCDKQESLSYKRSVTTKSSCSLLFISRKRPWATFACETRACPDAATDGHSNELSQLLYTSKA